MSELAGFQHRFIPAAGSSSRTLLLLHGTGGDENDLLGIGRLINPQAALLSPRGRVLENGMPRFFRRLAEGVFDEVDLAKRSDELATFVQSACQHYQRDPKQVIAVGFSNGANIAGALLYRHPAVIGGAVLIRPMIPFPSTPLPPLDAKPLLLLSARNDPIVSIAQSERLAKLLTAAGADVTLRWSNAGHSLSDADIAAATDWLATMKI